MTSQLGSATKPHGRHELRQVRSFPFVTRAARAGFRPRAALSLILREHFRRATLLTHTLLSLLPVFPSSCSTSNSSPHEFVVCRTSAHEGNDEKDVHGKLSLRSGSLRGRSRSGRGHAQVQLLHLCEGAELLIAMSPDAFRLLAGEAELTEYQFGSKNIHHLFCKHCGVRPFAWAGDPNRGTSLRRQCRLSGQRRRGGLSAPVVYVDGKHDAFQSSPAETRHL